MDAKKTLISQRIMVFKKMISIKIQNDVSALLEHFEVLLGKTSTFPPDKNHPDEIILKIDVYSPGLMQLNDGLKTTIAAFDSEYDEYVPHVTIAYLKPGIEKKWVGDSAFDKLSFIARDFQFRHAGCDCRDTINFNDDGAVSIKQR